MANIKDYIRNEIYRVEHLIDELSKSGKTHTISWMLLVERINTLKEILIKTE